MLSKYRQTPTLLIGATQIEDIGGRIYNHPLCCVLSFATAISRYYNLSTNSHNPSSFSRAMDAPETYSPLPPSPKSPCISEQAERAPPYIRTSFSTGYALSQLPRTVAHDTSPMVASPSAPSLRRHSQSRGHIHSKSMNSKEVPPPLPLPTEVSDVGYTSNNEYSDSRTEAVIRQWRLKRSQTDPGLCRGNAEQRETLPALPVSMKDIELGVQRKLSWQDNPRTWTPSQLAQYLLTALRFKSSEAVPLPKPVAQDIANFVVKCKLNGRVFLRLQDRDIEE